MGFCTRNMKLIQGKLRWVDYGMSAAGGRARVSKNARFVLGFIDTCFGWVLIKSAFKLQLRSLSSRFMRRAARPYSAVRKPALLSIIPFAIACRVKPATS